MQDQRPAAVPARPRAGSFLGRWMPVGDGVRRTQAWQPGIGRDRAAGGQAGHDVQVGAMAFTAGYASTVSDRSPPAVPRRRPNGPRKTRSWPHRWDRPRRADVRPPETGTASLPCTSSRRPLQPRHGRIGVIQSRSAPPLRPASAALAGTAAARVVLPVARTGFPRKRCASPPAYALRAGLSLPVTSSCGLMPKTPNISSRAPSSNSSAATESPQLPCPTATADAGRAGRSRG